MLKELTSNQAHFIALQAKAARVQRDEFLGNVAEEDLDDVETSRGEHNPTAALGYDPLAPESAQMKSLREAIVELTPAARTELYCLMRIGQGHLAAGQWPDGLAAAETLDEPVLTSAMLDDPDLHDHIAKGLYELGVA